MALSKPSLTPRVVGEILSHEGLVREAYRDSTGIWTWSVGITSASGHRVERYRDNPQSIEHCLAVFLWVLERVYLPPVLAAFGSHVPAEHELAAALSFHYNTGALPRCEWLRCFLAHDSDAARLRFLDWRRPAGILPRRRKERDLFFDARWCSDGAVLLYDVAKPSYRPVNARRVDVTSALAALLSPQAETAQAHAPRAPDEAAAFLPLDSGPSGPSAAPRPQAPPKRNWFDRLFD